MLGRKKKRRKVILESERAPKKGHPILWSVLIVLIASLAYSIYWITPRVMEYTAKVDQLPPSGGVRFDPPVVLDVPHFSQADPGWGGQYLGPTDATLAQEGCAMTCGAMVLNFYGVDIDPDILNRWLNEEDGGYNERGWIFWEKAARTSAGAVEHVYEQDLASFYLIDRELWRGNPVIAKVRMRSGINHFLVIVGKNGYDYLVLDPAQAPDSKPYRLSQFEGTGTPILGIRFFEQLEEVSQPIPDPTPPAEPEDEFAEPGV